LFNHFLAQLLKKQSWCCTAFLITAAYQTVYTACYICDSGIAQQGLNAFLFINLTNVTVLFHHFFHALMKAIGRHVLDFDIG